MPRATGPRNDVQGGGCAPSATQMCLNGDRFAVTGSWRTAQGSGAANTVELTDDTGYLWFFADSNVEVILKVLDACGLPGFGNFWVFAGGLTDQEVDVTVTDTRTGEVVSIHNDLGSAFDPFRDTSDFKSSCP